MSCAGLAAGWVRHVASNSDSAIGIKFRMQLAQMQRDVDRVAAGKLPRSSARDEERRDEISEEV